jgi:hypothetical protein
VIHGDEGETSSPREPTTAFIGPLGWSYVILLITIVAATLDYGVMPPPYRIEQRPEADIVARVDFKYDDPDSAERRRKEAGEAAPRVYREVEDWPRRVTEKTSQLCELVERAFADKLTAEGAGLRAKAENFDDGLAKLLYQLRAAYGANSLKIRILDPLDGALQRLSERGVLSLEDFRFEMKRPNKQKIYVERLRNGRVERTELPVESGSVKGPEPVLGLQQDRPEQSARLEMERGLPADPPGYGGLWEKIKWQLLLSDALRPSLTLDVPTTDEERRKAEAGVTAEPTRVQKGAVIVPRDQRIRGPQLDKLFAEATAYKESLSTWRNSVRRWLGLGAFVAALMFFFLTALRRLRPELFERPRALFVAGLFSLIVPFAAKAAALNGVSLQVVPLTYVCIVISLSLGRLTALVAAAALVLPLALMGAGVMGAGALLLGAWVAALPAYKLFSRWDLIRCGMVGGAAQGVAAGLMYFLPPESIPATERIMQWDVFWALFAPSLWSLAALGTLPLVESAFGIVTNIRLVELCDPHRPALRRLMMEAPGTWAHSLQVAYLAEPAAEAVGANARLLRAGCYYHDLGKALKPDYFVENRTDAGEQYKRLAPSVGALIIAAHVKDGIALAREYRLPEAIVDFIPQHHGTTLISWFYHSALKQANEANGLGDGKHPVGAPAGATAKEATPVHLPAVKDSGRANGTEGEVRAKMAPASAVDESFFRYPGPKPQSREAAILMMADTVEAASRTMDHPSQSRLRTFVHKLIVEKLADGQFDECPLTFRDLAVIEASFQRTLVARFHARVRYPDQAVESTRRTSPNAVTQEAPTIPPQAPK